MLHCSILSISFMAPSSISTLVFSKYTHTGKCQFLTLKIFPAIIFCILLLRALSHSCNDSLGTDLAVLILQLKLFLPTFESLKHAVKIRRSVYALIENGVLFQCVVGTYFCTMASNEMPSIWCLLENH